MPVVASSLSFGGYTFPVGAMLQQRNIDMTIDENPMLGRDGTYAPSGTAQAGIVVVKVELGGGGDFSPATQSEMITLDDLNDELNRMYAQLANGYGQLIVGETPARYAIMQKRKFQVDYAESTNRAHGTGTIEFYAQDPRWLSSATHSSAPASSISVPISNAGNVRTFPIVTFNGPTSGNPAIAVSPVSGGTLTQTFGVVLAGGDVLVVNCDPRTPFDQRVVLNGVNRVDLLGATGISSTTGNDFCFPYLDGGSNAMTLGGGFTSGNATIAWRDAWGL